MALEPYKPTFASPTGGAASDVVIIGAGLAGLFTALKLSPVPSIVISAQSLGRGTSSAWAQAGIAAAVDEGDRVDDHAADTIQAGAGIVDEAIAELLARHAPDRVEDLLRYGVPFDRDLEGKLQLSHEAAHGARRILRVKGDLAGRAIMAALTQAARRTTSIRIIEGASVHRLNVKNGRVRGVLLSRAGSLGMGDTHYLPARAVVLATGGLGQLYLSTTNPPGSVGEGLAMAAKAGAVIADAEFVQFHPTALDLGLDPAPLATEALRGEGATLVNGAGERFMTAIHEDAELAPRDIVARGVYREAMSGRGAYLDCRGPLGDRLAEAFPAFQKTCERAGIDPREEPVPVAPAAHYHMGGILTDARGRTTVDGLWACGEVASTGAHGANRLASNSLLEAVVFGALIAEDIAGLIPTFRDHMGRPPSLGAMSSTERSGSAASERIHALRRLMNEHCSVIREHRGLTTALESLGQLRREQGLPPAIENMVLTASLVAAAAFARQESRGAHFRSDYPEADAPQARRSYMTLSNMEAVAHDSAGAAQTADERSFAAAS